MLENVKRFLKSSNAAFAQFFLFFGGFWAVLEPLGIPGSRRVLGCLAAISLISTIVVDWIRLRVFLLPECRRAGEAESSAPKVGCCVTGETTGRCPLGVKRIYEHTDQTIRESMANTEKKLVWFGLSAFNVVHNNLDVLRNLRHRQLTFYLVSDAIREALDKHDSRRPDILTPLSSKELTEKGVSLIQRLHSELGNTAEVRLKRYDMIHTFRLILVDDNKAYVSFYEEGSDALKSHQLLLEHTEDVPYPILPWFREFVERIDRFHAVEQTFGDSDTPGEPR